MSINSTTQMKKESFSISSFSVVTSFICIMLVGLAVIPFLPYRSHASVDMPEITVSFNTRNHLSPRIVENEVTNILEQALSRTENVVSVISKSGSDNGNITLRMAKGTDMEKAKFAVTTNIHKIWDMISAMAYYPEVNVTNAINNKAAFMEYSVSATQPTDRIIKFVERDIIPQLSLVKGVKELNYNHERDKQYLLKYDSRLLEDLQVDAGRITSLINKFGSGASLGMIPYRTDDGHIRTIRLTLESSLTVDDVMRLNVKARNGRKIPLSSLVTIVPEENLYSNTRINGQNTVFISISAKDDANEMTVSKEVKKVFDEISTHVPQGYSIILQNDDSEDVASELQNIAVRSAITILILIVFIFISSRDIKVSIVTILSMMASLLISVIGYFLFKVEMNMYALAGITISLSLIIDNSIVMSNQIFYERNRNVFQPMFAATLTTIGALSIVFFLSEVQKAMLTDFALVIIINLSASLFTATFFVPALMDKMEVTSRRQAGRSFVYMKAVNRLNRYYGSAICLLSRHRILVMAILILSFGIPVYLLPVKLNGEGKTVDLYNDIFGSDFYNDKLRSTVNNVLGGSIYRLYKTMPKLKDKNTDADDRPSISIGVSIPPGGKPEMLNVPLRRMESLLSILPGIKKYVTDINGKESASISIYFHKYAIAEGMPMSARNKIVDRALSISGVSWSVSGPGDAQFANTARKAAGQYHIKIKGYNYDELNRYANLIRDSLEVEKRVRDITVASYSLGYMPDYSEFDLKISSEAMNRYSLTLSDINNAISSVFGAGNVMSIDDDRANSLLLRSEQSSDYDQWNFMNRPINIRGMEVKLSDIATIRKHVVPMDIYKSNQEYELYVQYNYKGSMSAAYKMRDRKVENISKILPMGFSIEEDVYHDGNDFRLSPWLILIIIAIMFVTTSVLLNSLKQPFAIIVVIPVSFIGMFLAFSTLDISFGVGGMAALVLLCGQTINASIYMTYEYNVVKGRHGSLSSARAFVKSCNKKIVPILLTVLSTILGFVPFLTDDIGSNDFWYSLSVGTIAGLLASLIGVLVFLPTFLVRKQKKLPPRDGVPSAFIPYVKHYLTKIKHPL